ncbi:hypothetical protein C0J52_07278 [Blattella germanica]|nr:hypothetical protein C0J52_07278 [Blattella germanica]
MVRTHMDDDSMLHKYHSLWIYIRYSHLKLKVTLRVTGGNGTHLFSQSAYKTCEVDIPTRQPPSSPGKLTILISV